MKLELPTWLNTALLVLIVVFLLFRFIPIPQTSLSFPSELRVYRSNADPQREDILTDGNRLWVVDRNLHEVRVFEFRDGQITVAKHDLNF
ncbi:MAG: hypothetical protein ACYC5Y_10805 [Symbiobacteriia bacterium]